MQRIPQDLQQTMTRTRQHDKPSQVPPPRTERIFSEQDLWYFRTREHDVVGPFRYRSEAESNLDQFLADLKDRIEAISKSSKNA